MTDGGATVRQQRRLRRRQHFDLRPTMTTTSITPATGLVRQPVTDVVMQVWIHLRPRRRPSGTTEQPLKPKLFATSAASCFRVGGIIRQTSARFHFSSLQPRCFNDFIWAVIRTCQYFVAMQHVLTLEPLLYVICSCCTWSFKGWTVDYTGSCELYVACAFFGTSVNVKPPVSAACVLQITSLIV